MSEAVRIPTAAPSALGGNVLLYDGVCGLCQHTVQWMLRHDPDGRLFYVPQQSALAAEVCVRHSLDMEELNSVVLACGFGTPQERLIVRSNAVLACLRILGGVWAALARIAAIVPRPVRDAAYRLIARNRRRLFGTADQCRLPTPAERARFLDC